MILIVGDEPSRLNKSKDVAFVGARSEKRLLEWLAYLEIEDYQIINSHTNKLKKEIKNHTGPIIALGTKAYKRCLEYHDMVRVFKLPHPSGLNRQVNDKEYIKHQLKTCKAWLEIT